MDRDGKKPADFARRPGASHDSTFALLAGDQWPDVARSRARAVAPAPEGACQSFLTADFFRSSSAEDVQACLAAGSQPTSTDRKGNTAVHLAAAYGTDPRIIDRLLYRVRADDAGRLETLLRQTNLDDRSPLQLAAIHSTAPEVIGRLLAWGADVNQLAEPKREPRVGPNRGTTALHLAARRSDPAREAVLTVLLAGGAQTQRQDHSYGDGGGRQALHYVARHPDPRVIALFLGAEAAQKSLVSAVRGAVVRDDQGRTALHVATDNDADLETIWEMTAFGFKPDTADTHGVTPLMNAAQRSTRPEVFLDLLEESGKPCQAAKDGTTVTALLRANPDLHNPDPSGATLSPLDAYKARCP